MSALTPFPIAPPAGVVKTETSRVVEGRWIDSDKIRFVNGRPQKLGGWTVQTTEATSGAPRTIHCWRDLIANDFIAIGTYRKLYAIDIEAGFELNDITPFRETGTLGGNPFTTTIGSSIVTVSDSNHGLNAGDTVVFSGATTVNGITPNGSYIVVSIISSSLYTFDAGAPVAAGSGVGGGGSVSYSYEIGVGNELAGFGLGWGAGGWGLGTWGTERDTGIAPTPIIIEPRVWSLDHFGKILLASRNSGSIYTFDPTASKPWPRAQIIADSPDDTRAMFVTPERFVFALRENMIVSASSQSDYNTWTPASDNTAFSRTLTEGSRLVAGRPLAPFVSLVWTDAALYNFQYTGNQFVYNSMLVGTNCGLIGPNACVTVQGAAFWMGPDNFWMFNGSVVQIPNAEDIRHYVYSQLPNNTSFQSFAVYSPTFQEILFGYADGTQDYPTRYVLLSLKDFSWATGTLTRVAGHHFTQGDTRPYFADANGFVYLHEDGVNDNTDELNWNLTLAPVAISEGLYNMNLEAILFDFFEQAGDITATVNTYDRLNDASVMDTETETVVEGANPYTEFRVNGRYIGLDLSQTGMDTYFRMGKPAAFVKRSGTRS